MADHEASDGDAPASVPDSIRTAWGQQVRPARGPKPGLTLERIVRAAITVADAEGIDAVSMSRVAAELGSSAMSLYRYVGSKSELLALMVDTAMGTLPSPAPGEGWREGLAGWTRAALQAYLRAPWSVRIPISGPPVTPNQVRALEAGLACLRDTGLTHSEKLSTIQLLAGLTRYQATIAADFADAYRASGGQDLTAGYGRTLARLIDPATFPEVHAAVASGSLDDEDDPDYHLTELNFGLGRVLDGLEVLITSRQASAEPSGPPAG